MRQMSAEMGPADATLQAEEVCYWLPVELVRSGYRFEEVVKRLQAAAPLEEHRPRDLGLGNLVAELECEDRPRLTWAYSPRRRDSHWNYWAATAV